MYAIECRGKGSVDETFFEVTDAPIPEVGDNDILVRNYACAINPVDYKQRAHGLTGDQDKILGYDGAGVVEAVGANVQNFKVGDEVMYAGSIIRNGSNAQYTAVDSRIVGPKPKNASFAEAACLPLVSLTAMEGFLENLNLTEDPTLRVLVINGAGGVGSIAIQIAKKVLKSECVIGTASREETIEHVQSLGADYVINHRNNLKDELKAIGVDEVDVVFCAVDLELHYDAIVDLIHPTGKILSITFGDATKIDVSKCFFPKRLTLSFELMFVRPMFLDTAKPELQGDILRRIAELYEEGSIKSIMKTSFPELTLENLKQAHVLQESGQTIGKIALEIK